MDILGISIDFYLTNCVAVFALYSWLVTNDKPVISYIKKFLPDNHSPGAWLKLIDVMLYVVVGAFLATAFAQPTNIQQAIIAGLGFSAFLNTFADQ